MIPRRKQFYFTFFVLGSASVFRMSWGVRVCECVGDVLIYFCGVMKAVLRSVIAASSFTFTAYNRGGAIIFFLAFAVNTHW